MPNNEGMYRPLDRFLDVFRRLGRAVWTGMDRPDEPVNPQNGLYPPYDKFLDAFEDIAAAVEEAGGIAGSGGDGGGTLNHAELNNRALADQHPTAAITGLDSALAAKAAAAELAAHAGDTDNPHEVTAEQVGLGEVDNTSDADKPVSAAQQTALDGKVDKQITGSTPYAYTHQGETQGHMPISDAAGGGSLARYHDDGSLEVGAPQNDTDAVQKQQIDAVTEKIPAAATSSNKLADKAFVNSSIQNMAARRCRPDNTGSANWATLATLQAGPWYYVDDSGSWVSGPSANNDYALIQFSSDPDHGNELWRAVYNNGWDLDYMVNASGFTQAQIDQIDMGKNAAWAQGVDAGLAAALPKQTTEGRNVYGHNGATQGEIPVRGTLDPANGNDLPTIAAVNTLHGDGFVMAQPSTLYKAGSVIAYITADGLFNTYYVAEDFTSPATIDDDWWLALVNQDSTPVKANAGWGVNMIPTYVRSTVIYDFYSYTPSPWVADEDCFIQLQCESGAASAVFDIQVSPNNDGTWISVWQSGLNTLNGQLSPYIPVKKGYGVRGSRNTNFQGYIYKVEALSQFLQANTADVSRVVVDSVPDFANIETLSTGTAMDYTWTADADGFVGFRSAAPDATNPIVYGYIYVNGILMCLIPRRTLGNHETIVTPPIKIKKGDIVRWFSDYNSTSLTLYAVFYPCLYVLAGQTLPVYPLIDRPDTWPVNTEINFGGGLYGYCTEGFLPTNAPTTSAIASFQASGTARMIDCGGDVNVPMTDGTQSPYTVGIGDLFSYSLVDGSGTIDQKFTWMGWSRYNDSFVLIFRVGSSIATTLTANAFWYRAWIKYTKD